MSVLIVDRQDGITILTLNRPEKLNALALELRLAFAEEIERLRRDSDPGVVILTGSGRAFCVGLDLKEMGDPEFRATETPVTDPATLLRSLRQPVIGLQLQTLSGSPRTFSSGFCRSRSSNDIKLWVF